MLDTSVFGQRIVAGTNAGSFAEWAQTAEILDRQGDTVLAAKAREFVRDMPPVLTDSEQIAVAWVVTTPVSPHSLKRFDCWPLFQAAIKAQRFGEGSALADTSINEPAVIEFVLNFARPLLGECFRVEGACLIGTAASTDFCAPEVSALLEGSHGTPAFLRTCRRPHGMGGVTLNWWAVLGLNQ